VTDKYPVGTRLKYTQTTEKFATVYSSTYSSPNTTITVAENDDYTIANATITSPYYSYIPKPVGYPFYFDFTPTLTGDGSMSYSSTTVYTAYFSIVGSLVHIYISVVGTIGGTLDNKVYASIPFEVFGQVCCQVLEPNPP
jgi:hypothetical protein